ncbi:GNAT family N-acetyltransferase [Mesorhizobium sp. M0959]|uniref:GNAT family N-acetyltransferase n=1 Tax=Mesorhizobium sp. M0959 TaxID=2957034 RepID=UPI0033364CCD
MVHNSQRLSLRSDGQLARGTFRKPTENHAADGWDLIALCPQLDHNSLYCELPLVTDFSGSCVLVEHGGAVIGWLSAYRRPSDRSTLFIWQIAVYPEVHSTDLGKEVIVSALNRPPCEGVTHIEATETLGNWAPDCSSQLCSGPGRRQSGKFSGSTTWPISRD